MKSISLVLAIALVLASCAGSQRPSDQPQNAAAVTNAQIALEYMKLDKLSTAREFADKALSEDSGNATVQSAAGLVYERLGELGKAQHALAAAARIGHNDPNIQNIYAGFLCRTHKAAEGEKIFMKIVHDPLYQTPEIAYVNAGVCAHAAGNNIDAERYFRQALTIRPKMPEAMLQLGELLLDRGDTTAARQTVQLYLAVNPSTPDILWLGLRTERKAGDDTTAASYAQRLQQEFPTSEQARMLQSGLTR
jgi:type IV pilus assembly protein PilF